jgi:hypothetical protein
MAGLIAILIVGALWVIFAKINTVFENRIKKKEVHFGLLRCPLCTKALPDESLKLTRGASGKLFLSNRCRVCFMKAKSQVSPALLEDLARRGMIDPSSERPSLLRRLLRRTAKSETTKVGSKADTRAMKAYIRRFKRELAYNQHSRLCWVLEQESNDSDSDSEQSH